MNAYVTVGSTLLGLLLTSGAIGQSTFSFRTLDLGVDAPVFDALGVPLEGPGYLAELWGGPSADSLSPAVRVLNTSMRLIAPFLTDGYVFVGESVMVLSVPPFELAALQMRAWDASLGNTYEEVVARSLGGYGESAIFYAEGGKTWGLPTAPGRLIGLESFSLRTVIPEPSTSVLFAMGGLAALGFQRVLRRFKTPR